MKSLVLEILRSPETIQTIKPKFHVVVMSITALQNKRKIFHNQFLYIMFDDFEKPDYC